MYDWWYFIKKHMKILKGENMKNEIKIFGAREHNLKNISVSIPKDSLVVITGPSVLVKVL